MGKKIDLTGQKYNRLTVIKESPKRDSSGCVMWECQCDCGNITYASSNALRSNHKRSCGCLNIEQVTKLGHNNYEDITGLKFGKLTVISKSDIKKNKRIHWNCICDCGNSYIASGKGLRNGDIQSCGCLKSVGEQKISDLLRENNITYVREKIFDEISNYHRGVDIANKIGTEIISASDGTVSKVVYDDKYYGNYIEITEGKVVFKYAHLSEILVNENEYVIQSQIIGKMGSTGMSTGPHLHFEIKEEENYIDPTEVIEF